MSESTEMTIRGGSGAMFDRIARRYDMLNRIMSLGMDQSWRRRTVKALELRPGDRVLDLATGTGDLALRIARRNPEVSVVGVDPSEGMLAVGSGKVARAGLASRIELVVGDAQALPLPDDSVDGACIAFGIRNVPDRAKGLAEMARVVRPGRKVCVLELGEPRRGFFAPFTRFHIRVIVPAPGRAVVGPARVPLPAAVGGRVPPARRVRRHDGGGRHGQRQRADHGLRRLQPLRRRGGRMSLAVREAERRAVPGPAGIAAWAADALARLPAPTEPTALCAISVPAPVCAPERLLDLVPNGDALLWAAPGGDAIAGAGVAFGVRADGRDRFTDVAREAEALWSRLTVVRHPASAGPPPRLFGGLAFAPGAADGAPWTGLGDADFALPRWRLAVGARGGAELTLVVSDWDDPAVRRQIAGFDRGDAGGAGRRAVRAIATARGQRRRAGPGAVAAAGRGDPPRHRSPAL